VLLYDDTGFGVCLISKATTDLIKNIYFNLLLMRKVGDGSKEFCMLYVKLYPFIKLLQFLLGSSLLVRQLLQKVSVNVSHALAKKSPN